MMKISRLDLIDIKINNKRLQNYEG